MLSVLVLMAASVYWSGCGKAGSKPAVGRPAASTEAVDISTLPGFLRYPGAKATERVALSLKDSKGTVWTLVTGDPRDKVADWYRASVAKEGWNKSPEMDAGRSSMLEWEKPDKTETIKLLIYEQNGKTNISLTHGLK
jgi:hypothetical protein